MYFSFKSCDIVPPTYVVSGSHGKSSRFCIGGVMKSRNNARTADIKQRGAALVTVIFVSLLLGTACVAMLMAVGASSANNTDALAEAKAYYAAESGLQAAIKVFRYGGIQYSQAANDPDLSAWLGNGPIAVGAETTYTIAVSDPDNSIGQTIYATQGSFEQDPGVYGATKVFGTGADTMTVSFEAQPVTDVMPGTITPFGRFTVVKSGNGPTTLSVPLRFRIDYILSEPRSATRTIRGIIDVNGSISFPPTTVSPPTYSLMGGTLKVCASSLACTTGPTISLPPASITPQSVQLYGSMSAIEPYRLKVVATGYNNANGSRKSLEAIVQRNFFNDNGSSAAISMVGPNALFQVGPSSQMTINGGTVPSVTVSDPTGLQTVLNNHTNGEITPPPEVASNDVPDWQRDPVAMDALVRQLRQTAQNSGRYFNGTNPGSFGDFATGTGITFCEGSCSMGGSTSGGGILVVTGTFTTSGSPSFRGLVLAVGRYVSDQNPGGVVRSGGGTETFIGNIVIAPYNPANLNAGFEQPRYDQRGGPGDTINSGVDVNAAFNGTTAITDFMLGVAEK